MSLEVYLPLQFPGRVRAGWVLVLLQNFGRIQLWSHLVLGFDLLEDFLISVSISMCVMGLLRFSLSSWFNFGRLHFSKNSFISSKLSLFFWHIVADSSLLWSFVFLCCLLWFLHFIYNFVDLVLFPFFFLMSLANGLSILFIFSKNQLLVLLIFCYGLLCFFFIDFYSDFYDFFSSTNFGFLHFFFF